ncbi:endonuclease III domain-containing protein [Candidatus Oscillochloris fontis]|uniref:endonuclease III domain-containing protein n=1 Tax=Candidatus Oscillochloris fontis TaxID=2496868 RepID=UPI00101C8164|nr:endonuclease III [Candidatus Oscillochloris fontis]
MTTPFPITTVLDLVEAALPAFNQPLIDQMSAEQQTPFRILVATILSLRTKDTLTAVVAPRLFTLADTPASLLALGEQRLAELIYPVGFYQNKARSLIAIAHMLLERYNGAVPSDLEALLELPGVGRKTANLVRTAGFGLPGICVDIHVHRITNRWGYVATKDPDTTEMTLRTILPTQYWIPINRLLVTFGQNICHPTSPHCSTCPVAAYCARIGVTRSR